MTAFAWGLGKSGQLGNGDTVTCEIPQRVKLPPGVTIKAVSAGALYSGFLTSQGEVYCVGCGKHGRLGTGGDTDVKFPVKVPSLGTNKIVQISCGFWHGGCVDETGQVYVWGYNKKHGVLGSPTPAQISAPIPPVSLRGIKIKGLSCGNNFTLAWSENGEAFSWGCGRNGVLGHADEMDREEPQAIQALKSVHVTSMDAGFAHCGAVTSEGHLYMFGQSKDGALGLATKDKVVSSPTLLESLLDSFITAVGCSKGEHHGHTLALSKDGACFSWGDGYKGKLGLGDQESRLYPKKIQSQYFDEEKVVGVCPGGIHSTAVTDQGRVYTWGCGSDGRLGHPEAKGHRYLFRSDIPKLVEHFKDVQCVQISASYYHTLTFVEKKKT